MNKRVFDTSLSWSHVLTLVGFGIAMVGGWLQMESRMKGVETTVAALQASVTSNDARMREADARAREADAEIRVGIRNLDGKITALMMQAYRGPAQMIPSPSITPAH